MRKIKLVSNNQDLRPLACVEPFPGADHVVVVDTLCPGCGASPFKVSGTGMHIAPNDRDYEADAVALCCDRRVGTLRVETNTLFGLREDEAIARSRCRIY
jgi:hypothetical protein